MRVIYVDDEKAALMNFYYDNRKRNDIESQEFFQNPHEALEYAKVHGVDAAFLDITMPEMDGIQLGKELKKVQPSIELVYVTGYDDYALDVFKIGGRAYLSKPYSEEELEATYTLLNKLIASNHENDRNDNNQSTIPKVHMKTFGNFDMICDNVSVVFGNSKSKELLALLVDNRGGSVTNTQIFYKLWEGKEYNNVTSTYVRRTVRALKLQLEEVGMSELLISSRTSQSVNTTLFTCDYYDILNGNMESAKEYRGYYMMQYSWAEETNAVISQIVEE